MILTSKHTENVDTEDVNTENTGAIYKNCFGKEEIFLFKFCTLVNKQR